MALPSRGRLRVNIGDRRRPPSRHNRTLPTISVVGYISVHCPRRRRFVAQAIAPGAAASRRNGLASSGPPATAHGSKGAPTKRVFQRLGCGGMHLLLLSHGKCCSTRIERRDRLPIGFRLPLRSEMCAIGIEGLYCPYYFRKTFAIALPFASSSISLSK